MEEKSDLVGFIEGFSVVLLGLFLFAFPLIFTTATTDFYSLPKQLLLGGVALVGLFLFGLKVLLQGSVTIRRTPYNLPLILFGLAVLLSSLFSLNRFESLINFVPLFFGIILFFLSVNFARRSSDAKLLLYSLLSGGAVSAILSLLNFFKIYVLPFAVTKTEGFTTFGSSLDQLIYFLALSLVALHFFLPFLSKLFRRGQNGHQISAAEQGVLVVFVFILSLGAGVSATNIVRSPQGPLILPYETGFQTAFSAISQDTGRVFESFLLGSGYGTFSTDFTRFKPPAFNQNEDLWTLTFLRSSSFVLELIATTGVLGLISFLFLVFNFVKDKSQKNPFFLSLAALFIASFLLPFSFLVQTLLLVLLSLYAVFQAVQQHKTHSYYDLELSFTTFRNVFPGLNQNTSEKNKVFPILGFLVMLLVVGFLGFYTLRFAVSDLGFRNSLIAASQNEGSRTYDLQRTAIQTFPYRDAYHRIFSQTNFALANSVAASVPQGSSPSAQQQQTIYTLIQQSINSGRSAVTLSPLTAANWQNLSQLYRNLIGFGQNAEQFALATAQRAVQLDPNNPQAHVSLGGVYYRLNDFENAQRYFQIAVSLKPDFANARYNLGHALEEKGELEQSLQEYEAVRTLVQNDEENLRKIEGEIEALRQRIENPQPETPEVEPLPQDQADQQLEVPGQESPLPEQDPRRQIPAPEANLE